MFEAITSWLQNGCNFAQGAGLYARYGTDQFFIRLLERGETPMMLEKLTQRLTAMLDVPASSIATNCGMDPQAEASQNNAVTHGDILPAASQDNAVRAASQENAVPDLSPTPAPGLPPIMAVKDQLSKNFGELAGLHPYLHIIPEGEDLRLLAVQILQLGKKNTELWERYNYLTEHPEAAHPDMPAPACPVMIDFNLVNKYELVRKSLNKAENRIKGNPKPNKKTLALIAARRQELKELAALIAEVRKGKAE